MYQQAINLKNLEGKWYIILSNFPMWLKGDKTNTTFNYKISTKDGMKGLTDEVIYTQNRRQKSIKGFDIPLNELNNSFKWRGYGLLSLLSSKWQILHLDTTKNWAIIYFERTLFTPKGYDIIAREKQLNEATLKEINNKLRGLGINENLKKL